MKRKIGEAVIVNPNGEFWDENEYGSIEDIRGQIGTIVYILKSPNIYNYEVKFVNEEYAYVGDRVLFADEELLPVTKAGKILYGASDET